MFYKNEFLDYLKKKRLNEKTVKSYSYLITNFEMYYQERNINNVKKVNDKNVFDYLKIRKERLNSKNYNIEISRLKIYFNFLVNNKYVFISPLSDYESPKFYHSNHPVYCFSLRLALSASLSTYSECSGNVSAIRQLL